MLESLVEHIVGAFRVVAHAMFPDKCMHDARLG